jgi:hypothetical protein
MSQSSFELHPAPALPVAEAERRPAPERPGLIPAERDGLSAARGFALGMGLALMAWAVGATAYLLL